VGPNLNRAIKSKQQQQIVSVQESGAYHTDPSRGSSSTSISELDPKLLQQPELHKQIQPELSPERRRPNPQVPQDKGVPIQQPQLQSPLQPQHLDQVAEKLLLQAKSKTMEEIQSLFHELITPHKEQTWPELDSLTLKQKVEAPQHLLKHYTTHVYHTHLLHSKNDVLQTEQAALHIQQQLTNCPQLSKFDLCMSEISLLTSCLGSTSMNCNDYINNFVECQQFT